MYVLDHSLVMVKVCAKKWLPVTPQGVPGESALPSFWHTLHPLPTTVPTSPITNNHTHFTHYQQSYPLWPLPTIIPTSAITNNHTHFGHYQQSYLLHPLKNHKYYNNVCSGAVTFWYPLANAYSAQLPVNV
jgi:hypothetical protein